ncbi:MAG TPA: diacylglycerol kinase family protein [Acidimicrobiales bacterium]|nr:diacylglycerol kinase family protein [Acidimicrobiales bacterium]
MPGRLPVRFLRRAAVRGSLAAAMTLVVPRRRRAAAAAAAFIGGAALEVRALAPLLVPAVAVDPLATAAGAGAAFVTTRFWPVAPHEAAELRPVLSATVATPSPTGAGLVVVVNRGAGGRLGPSPAEELRAGLPDAEVVEVGEDDDIDAALDDAVERAMVLGVAGGDGTINAAAGIALAAGKPLVVVPAGTLNHLARDLGLHSVADAIAAVRAGETSAIDVARIDGHVFLNTASFGGYVEMVDAREALETAIGKWPAVLVALARVWRASKPTPVVIDGARRRVWLVFFGNCRYHPSGFTPSWRERLDDGLLDIRMVDATEPWSRARLVSAVLTGRLGRSRVYEQRQAERVEVEGLDGPMRLSADGETFDGKARFTVEKAGLLTVVVGASPSGRGSRAGR